MGSTTTATATSTTSSITETNGKASLASSSPLVASSLWDWYKNIARNNRLTLDILEDTIEKLLFWLPHAETDDGAQGGVSDGMYGDAAWREVGYGILSLHRLSMDLALDDDNENSNNNDSEFSSNRNIRKNHYGMSIRTKNSPTIAATSARICLTVIHSLMPSLISLVMLQARRKKSYINNGVYVYNSVSNSNNSNNNNTHRNIAVAASKARLVLEQAKFLLRMTLLVHYWRQQQQQNCTHQTNDDSATVPDFGVMLDGGMYHSDRAQESIGIPWDHARALQRRRNYVGERTGWNATTTSVTASSCNTGLLSDYCPRIVQNLFGNNSFDRNYRNAKTVLAELLYSARPLLWAWLESRHHATVMTWNREPTWPIAIRNRPGASLSSEITKARRRPSLLKGWLLCLAMDVLSIRLLEHHRRPNPRYPASKSDPFAHQELKRRKMRLLLYVLRAPVWNNHTLPMLEGVSQKVLRKMPLVGNLLETVLWDWILYYQHPFVSEEG